MRAPLCPQLPPSPLPVPPSFSSASSNVRGRAGSACLPSCNSCGLFVVSTAVGGVPEVLPRHMIKFAEPTVDDLVDALSDAIPLARKVVPSDFHAKASKATKQAR